ncbi:MAG: hypothetical protein P1U34_12400 [Coxiellaceae bacterium]|nr:hypothetical protein [Coxiellaceae bacterium]
MSRANQQELLKTLKQLTAQIKGHLSKLPEAQKATFKAKLNEQRDNMAREIKALSRMRDNSLRIQVRSLIELHDKLPGVDTPLAAEFPNYATASNNTLKATMDIAMVRVRTVTEQKKSGVAELRVISRRIGCIYGQVHKKVLQIDKDTVTSLNRLLKEVKKAVAEIKLTTTASQQKDADFAWGMMFEPAKETAPATTTAAARSATSASSSSDAADPKPEQDGLDSFTFNPEF